MMNDFAHIFLGSNSGEGFCSLYDQLLHGRMDDLLIIKGGPGCGKSSFMRAAAKELTAARWETAYVHCSGDPDSLDGVLFPSRRVGMVDGTAPHETETKLNFCEKCRFYAGLRALKNMWVQRHFVWFKHL